MGESKDNLNLKMFSGMDPISRNWERKTPDEKEQFDHAIMNSFLPIFQSMQTIPTLGDVNIPHVWKGWCL